MNFSGRFLLLLVAVFVGLAGLVSTALVGPASAAGQHTVIRLSVSGCAGCSIEPVQIRNGQVTYAGSTKTVVDGRVRFRVPTGRTRQMTFLLYAPFDTVAQGGLPLTPVTRFKRKAAGNHVGWTYARAKRRVSACWAGTSRRSMSNTLVVKKISRNGKTTAGAFFTRTLPSGPNWWTVTDSSLHSADPSTCP